MYTNCFKLQDSEIYSCKTKDLNTFNCECLGVSSIKTLTELEHSTEGPDSFPFWLDGTGQHQENVILSIENGKNQKWINLRQLFDYCQKNTVYLECNTLKRRYRDIAQCYCKDESDKIKSLNYEYKSDDVWSVPKVTTREPLSFDSSDLNSISDNYFYNSFYIFILVLLLCLIKKFIDVRYRKY